MTEHTHVPQPVADAARRGARLLDEKNKSYAWYEGIDLTDLDMNSLTKDVLGKIYGNYSKALVELGIDGARIDEIVANEYYGFAPIGDEGAKALNEAWRIVIQQRRDRRAAQAVAPPPGTAPSFEGGVRGGVRITRMPTITPTGGHDAQFVQPPPLPPPPPAIEIDARTMACAYTALTLLLVMPTTAFDLTSGMVTEMRAARTNVARVLEQLTVRTTAQGGDA